MNPHDVILYPLMTERSVFMIENQNKLVFIVKREATKLDISRAVQILYGVETESINTLISRKSVKKAFVKLTEAHDASDLAIRLGIL